MEARRFPTHRKPKYEGEDTSPTTARELKGFYAYSVAAEVFAVCGVGSFLPVTLEQLARERGVLWSDKTTSCMFKAAQNATVTTSHLLSRATGGQNNQCVVRVLGSEMTTSSFAMYTFSLAVFVQALALVSFSAVADFGDNRKKLLLGFGFTGAVSSMMFLLVVPKIFLLGSLLVIVGVTCLGSSFVILNSFLPVLVANHLDIQHAPSSSFDESSSKTDSPTLALSTKVSSKGVGIGYMAAVFVQVLSIILLFSLSKVKGISSTLPLRLVLFLVGTWWFAFTIPSSLWLRSRPGPPLPTRNSAQSKFRSILSYTTFAWKSLFDTIKLALKLKQILLFLIAWFLLSDSIATVSGTAILFARTELHMGTVAIALLSITATSSGILGAFVWPLISRRYELPTQKLIIACVCAMEIIPLYGLLGFIPFVKHWGVGGLQKSWEIYPLGIVHGFVMGGLSSYCRAFYGRLIPEGKEAAFYALYAVTDKGSSAVGPAIVGMIVDRTGTIRGAFVFLAVLVILPIPLMWCINVEKGVDDARSMAGGSREGREMVMVGNEFSLDDDDDSDLGSEDGEEGRRLMRGHEL
ncbi:MFS general substrate transporter [Glarea lozoyensis ATCC 20868]|uniref:Autophagy-related protein n=1 Tax=Glarea lozoyensis (strain ATCC 20868 / MF5171) TaxID=1116229 RepID=S3CZR4_GLAL2|nr:MFS general substrate transporter [Glarea lozoyensis ATCC 20868]EPE31095.1 MFS general substrate transporter [Glarea lozoyensis ATCC 20868]